jgi:hypothetical protein
MTDSLRSALRQLLSDNGAVFDSFVARRETVVEYWTLPDGLDVTIELPKAVRLAADGDEATKESETSE